MTTNDPNYVESQRPRPGNGEFAKFAELYGSINVDHKGRSDLDFYPYHHQLDEAMQLMADHGYMPWFGGGKFGVPDLATRNYYSGYLMIYDPADQYGRIAVSKEYLVVYSLLHELAHALTLERLNRVYGEGRRLGALGKH